MERFRRHAWWYLAFLSVLLALFGIGDLLIGPAFDPGITQGLAGLTPAELQAQSTAGYRMLDFYTRIGGVHLIVIGVAMTAILAIPYRRGERWAWRAMWLLPAWTALGFATNVAFGVVPGQAPPPPMISGPILGALAVVALLLNPRRSAAGELGASPFAVPAGSR